MGFVKCYSRNFYKREPSKDDTTSIIQNVPLPYKQNDSILTDYIKFYYMFHYIELN